MRWPLGGRKRGRPVLPSRHPAPPMPPPDSAPTQTYPPPMPPSAPAQPRQTAGPPPVTPRQSPPPAPAPKPAPPAPTATPPPEPPAATDDERPATRAEVRSLRRWLAVAAIWAVAATAIAVLAFLEANNDDDQQIADASRQARSLQRELNRLESRIAEVPQNETVAGIEKRLAVQERVAARADQALASANRQFKDLRRRVDALEEAAAEAEETNTTTTP